MKKGSEKRQGSLWEPIVSGEKLVKNALKLAKRDIGSAERALADGDKDWSFAIAYNAMLQAGRALMFSEGFRPKGEFKHVAVVEFIREKHPGFAERLLESFDRNRKRRHKVVYEEFDTVSEGEAKRAIAVAGEFLEEVEGMLR
jgi:uncharacterized protein (UPF0332 family)